MKKNLALLLILALFSGLLSCCAPQPAGIQIAATTLPVYEFTSRLCQGTPIRVTRLITENVSCLHDYTLQISQMRAIEASQAIVISGAGLEDFLEDILEKAPHVIDASNGIPLLPGEDPGEENDPHIWLSPDCAKSMAANICAGLSAQFPENAALFNENLSALDSELNALKDYGKEALRTLSCRDLITFHDGFSYFACSFELNILRAVEEESGSETSASELIELIRLVRDYTLPSIFTERSGSTAAASIIAAETGAGIYTLDMGIASEGYFEAMYHNIETIKEALE